ncbi:MAG: hypothetical protein ACLPSL_00685 [Smithella sp.]|jgi:hypothetical protein
MKLTKYFVLIIAFSISTFSYAGELKLYLKGGSPFCHDYNDLITYVRLVNEENLEETKKLFFEEPIRCAMLPKDVPIKIIGRPDEQIQTVKISIHGTKEEAIGYALLDQISYKVDGDNATTRLSKTKKQKFQCPAEQVFHPERVIADGMDVIKLSARSVKNVIRYINMTEGTPPDLSKIPGYEIYLIYGRGPRFVEHGHSLSQAAIDIVKNGCVFYRMQADDLLIENIINGTWRLNTY